MTKNILTLFSFLLFCQCSSDFETNDTNVGVLFGSKTTAIYLTDPTPLGESPLFLPDAKYLAKIQIPDSYRFITGAVKNFIRIIVIDLDKKDCVEFYKTNEFEPIGDGLPRPLACMNYLDSKYWHPDNKKLLCKFGWAKRTYWTYLLDTTNCRLYFHVSAPDYNAYTK